MTQKYTVIINGRFLSQKMTGVHRYAYEMCCALKRAGVNFLVVSPKNILPIYDICFDLEKCGKYNSHFWEQIELPFYLKKKYKNHLLISFTGLGSIFHRKMICTVHDISFLVHPEWFSKTYYFTYKWLTPISIKRALKIITVSEFSKNELISKFGIPLDKICVVYNAVTPKVTSNQPNTHSRKNYILTVSSLDPRKNFKRLIEAYNLMNDSRYKLYIIGKKDRVFKDIDFEGLEQNTNIIFTGYVSDEQLAQFYSKASLFIYPSLYEGFGIPNLEAMKNDCPIVISDIPPHREVCGDAAIYFNPLDIEDMANKMSALLDNDSLRNEMKERGKARTKLFSWDKSAEKLITLINTLK